MAAARCSESQLLAVPGSPASISARSEASVAMATWTNRRSPTNFGVISTAAPLASRTGSRLPSTNVSTARGESSQPGGRAPWSAARNAASSAAQRTSAGWRTTSPLLGRGAADVDTSTSAEALRLTASVDDETAVSLRTFRTRVNDSGRTPVLLRERTFGLFLDPAGLPCDPDDRPTLDLPANDLLQGVGRIGQRDLVSDRIVQVRRAQVRGQPLPDLGPLRQRDGHRVDPEDVDGAQDEREHRRRECYPAGVPADRDAAAVVHGPQQVRQRCPADRVDRPR